MIEEEKKRLLKLIKKYNPDFTKDQLMDLIELSPVNVFISIKAAGPIKKGYPEKRTMVLPWDKRSTKDADEMQRLLYSITAKLGRCKFCNRTGTTRYGVRYYCRRHAHIPVDMTFHQAIKKTETSKTKNKMPRMQREKISKALKRYNRMKKAKKKKRR